MGLREDIVNEALSCLDTPWVHQGRLREVGLDCMGVIIYVAVRLNLRHQDLKAYPRRPNGQLPILLNTQLVKIDGPPMPADVISMVWTTEPWHVAIMATEDRIIHSYAAVGKCVIQPYEAIWKKRTRGVYRFRELIDG